MNIPQRLKRNLLVRVYDRRRCLSASAVTEPVDDETKESRKDDVADDKKQPDKEEPNNNDVKHEEADPTRLLQQFSDLHACVFNF